MSDSTIIVISGPAGSGKGTVVRGLLEDSEHFATTISATTREIRGDDIPGVTYNFVTKERFKEMIVNGELAEYAKYVGGYYGTLRSEIEKHRDSGKNVILEIDTKGALQIKSKYPDALLIWLCPPDSKTLEERLVNRGTNTPENIRERLDTAKSEMLVTPLYDYVVVNHTGKSAQAVQQIKNIISIYKCEIKRNLNFLQNFFTE